MYIAACLLDLFSHVTTNIIEMTQDDEEPWRAVLFWVMDGPGCGTELFVRLSFLALIQYSLRF